ncbi:MAG: SRPBCC family protein [Angustibacter sp.]
MTAVTRYTVEAPAEHVYDVLADGWSYAAWVVGASRVRDVDVTWPDEGARIHHSIGAWPFLVNDKTTVIANSHNESIELDVAVLSLGRGRVTLRIEPEGEHRCTVEMREHMYDGLLSKVPDSVIDPLLHHRNVESLRRLAAIAEGRGAATGTEREDHP